MNEKLEDQLKEIKKEMTELRKLGVVLLIADMKIASVPSKIQMFNITNDQKDRKKIEQMFLEARQEMEDAKNERADEMINEIRDLITMEEKDKATIKYKVLALLFAKLSREKKEGLKEAADEIRKGIAKL